MPSSWPWILLLQWRERRELRLRVAEELRFHLEQAAADETAAGSSRRQAKAAAAARLGDRRAITRDCLSALGPRSEASPVEVRRAKTLALAATAVVTPPVLALLLLAHHLRPLPVEDPSSLSVSQRPDAYGFAVARQFPQFTAAFRPIAARLEAADGPAEALGFRVSSGFFRLQGVRLALGSVETAGAPCLVLGDRLWRNQFGADPSVAGRTVSVSGETLPICGVAAREYWFLDRSRSLWIVGEGEADRWSAAYLLLRGGEPPKAAERSVALVAYRDVCRGTVSAAVALFEFAVCLLAVLGLAQAAALGRALGGCRKGFRLLARSYLFLLAKGLPVLAAPAILWTVAMESAALVSVGYFSKVWFLVSGYLLALLLTAIVWRVVADQQTRCPVCHRDLAMPLTLGVTGSILFDLPAVEYICAYGHGTLYRPEPTSEGVREPSWSRTADWWDALLGASASSTSVGG
ncbi:MAG: hypothetical protein GC160_06190 [Acidobacteria bacterium]|nr:hypothetical protein [Acidobacteriota bacterium]